MATCDILAVALTNFIADRKTKSQFFDMTADIVVFPAAVRRVARLCRVLVSLILAN